MRAGVIVRVQSRALLSYWGVVVCAVSRLCSSLRCRGIQTLALETYIQRTRTRTLGTNASYADADDNNVG